MCVCGGRAGGGGGGSVFVGMQVCMCISATQDQAAMLLDHT